jgi:hypothetical protein
MLDGLHFALRTPSEENTSPHNFPEQFTVEGHEHAGAFHENEVRVRTLPYLSNSDLPKISPFKKPATTD